jgi:cell division protein FtsX
MISVPSASYRPPLVLTVTRALRRGLKAFVRDRGWLPSLLALTGMAFLFQLIVVGSEAGFAVQALLREAPGFRIPLVATANDQAAQNFFSNLRTQTFVQDAQFVTRDQILEEQRKTDTAFAEFIDRYNLRNPFPDTVIVRLRELDSLPTFASFIQAPEWREVIDPAFLAQMSAKESQSSATLSIAKAAGTVSSIALTLTTLAMLAAVAAFLRARSLLRRDEVLVLRLLGERPFFLLLPFAVEALALLFCAFLLGGILVTALLALLPAFVPAFSSIGPLGGLFMATLTGVASQIFFLLGIELLLLLVLAIVGAYIGVRRSSSRSPLLSLLHVSH